MKIIIALVMLATLSACATQGDPCDDPSLHCNFVHPLPPHAARAVIRADGSVQLKGLL